MVSVGFPVAFSDCDDCGLGGEELSLGEDGGIELVFYGSYFSGLRKVH